MSPPPVISSTLVGSSINDLFASSLGISSPKRRSVIIGTGDNPSTIAGVNLTRFGSDIIISLGTSDTLMGVCRTLPEKYDSKVSLRGRGVDVEGGSDAGRDEMLASPFRSLF